MNTIKFKVHDKDENRELFLEVFIDGKPLSQIIEEYIGCQRDLGPIQYPYNANYHLLGYKDKYLGDVYRVKKYILDCQCGIKGCDDIHCKITFDEEHVIWSDFRGTFINLSDFEGFVFDENQYHQELATLPANRRSIFFIEEF